MASVVRPRVSAIVPIYNVEGFLNQALTSIENQTLKDLEIICVNDGSTDRSLNIMQDHAQRDVRLRIIDKPNGGYGAACNTGIEHALGTWVAIVEPDDWIEPTMFADMVAFAESFEEPIDIVKTPYWRIVNPDTPEQRKLNCSYKGRIRPRKQPFAMTDAGVSHLLIHHPSIWSALYRKSFLDDRGIRFREIPGAGWADNPFLIETLCQAHSIAYLNRAYYCYREETDEKTSSFVKGNAMVPFERWHDMVDELERIGVSNEQILRAQIRRGFTYLDYVIGEPGTDEAVIGDIMAKMFARMRDDLVLSESSISPAWKARYREVKGLAGKRGNPLPYAGTLIGAGLYSLKNIGPLETLKLIGAVSKRDKNAESISSKPNTNCRDAETPTVMISLVVPIYNGEQYLADCLDSIARQTYQNYEIVCVNDGSTDQTSSILKQRSESDGRMVVIDKVNGGPSSARNAGIEQARGDYIVFLDCDDKLEPDALCRIAKVAEGNCHDAIVFGWSCFPEGEANDWLLAHTNVHDALYEEFEPALLFDEMTNPYLRVAINRNLLRPGTISFDENLRVGEDATFLFDLFPEAHSTRLISDKLYRYRMPHEGSIMSTSRDGTPEKCLDDLNMMISIFGNWNRNGLLDPYGAQLTHWFISFLLYTVLRQPESVREPLVALSRDLLLAHFSSEELRCLSLPRHDFALIELVLSASEDGALQMNRSQLARTLMRWRIAEHGISDLVMTIWQKLTSPTQ